ncbi:BREX-1 system adenine-specific DNA-methyltransferase PglX, partial [Fusobacterium massiliense]|uniref:BREX-1 system adenine-specific DNA-methyltransferase PglX n=1 Tax=Fusobacterium massiliense TaxID=1852365 RepID=UPI0028D27BA9
PAMGSGHILVYAFDLLFEMYENLGWSTKESVLSILKNNLYGLEIDERAGQLASFALMMKAREKFSRLFLVLKREEAFKLNTLIIEESNSLSERIRNRIKANNLNNLNKIIQEFEDAKEYGSILKLESIDKEILEKEFNILKESFNNNEQETLIFNEDEMTIDINEELELIESLIKQHTIMTDKFDIIVTNPPYMGNSRMNGILKEYIDKNYSDVKSDLFAVFFIKCGEITKRKGYLGFMSPFVWMFIKSYEELRKIFIEGKTISSLVQLEYSGFEDATVPICTFVLQNSYTDKKGEYIKLSDFKGTKNQPIKTLEAVKNPNCNWRFQAKQKDFEKIPGSPIAYWVSDKVREIFEKNQKLGDIGEAITKGIFTGKNDYFLKLWQEVNFLKIGNEWKKYSKAGGNQKWYGLSSYILRWHNNGNEIKSFSGAGLGASKYFGKPHIVWSGLTSSSISFRYEENNIWFDDVSPAIIFSNLSEVEYLLGIGNSKFVNEILKIINPTLHYQIGDIKKIPIIFSKNIKIKECIIGIVKKSVFISKEEWDSRETSWDFEKLSLIDGKDLKTTYENYCSHWRDNFVQLHKNEEELNRLFIEIYDLQDEMDEKVAFDDITILKKEANIIQIDNSISKEFSTESEKYLYDRGVSLEFNKDELVKQFLSYAVGCIMGRYSVNKSGLIMANSDDILELSENKFIVKGTDGEIKQEIESKFLPDEFGIIPITDEKDFSNDIVEKVKEFIKCVYGEENLKDNLNFIAEALGNKDNKPAEEIIRTYFIKDFYLDHLQRYQKRPIYWLMNSGKKNAFSCLFYMHRYEPLTVARVRADYLIPYQEMLENKRKFIERQLSDDDISAKEKKNIEKQLKELDTLLKELREYANEVKHIAEQKIPLDLDDGVNVNYEKLGAILKKRAKD